MRASSAKVPVLASLALFIASTAAFSSQILLPTQSSSPGATIVGQITFASQSSSISGVQFDVQYDNAAMSLAATLSSPAGTSGKSLYAVDLAPNKKRFLIIGLNQNLIPDGTLLNLSVNINAAAADGTYTMTLSNVCGTDPSGHAATVTGNDGTVTVNASTAKLQSNGVVNAGSFLPGPVAPGELVTLMGSGIGPASAQATNGPPSQTMLGGTSVLFDGAAAPLLYAASNQINAIVPFSVSGENATQLTVTAQGQTIAAVVQSVAAAAPAVFTLDSTGTGPGAILNADLSVNSPSNPATKGSFIVVFATGAGQTNPPSVDGLITGTVLPTPILPVSAQIATVTPGWLLDWPTVRTRGTAGPEGAPEGIRAFT